MRPLEERPLTTYEAPLASSYLTSGRGLDIVQEAC